MKFLTADEIPETEKERRRGIQAAIDTYQAYIDREWASKQVYIDRLIAVGDAEGERHLRASIEKRVHQFVVEQNIFRRHLPPYLEYREDGILERIANPNG